MKNTRINNEPANGCVFLLFLKLKMPKCLNWIALQTFIYNKKNKENENKIAKKKKCPQFCFLYCVKNPSRKVH